MMIRNSRTGPRGRVLEGGPHGEIIVVHSFAPTLEGGGINEIRTHNDILPDFGDPATLGCLLPLVREAHRDPFVRAVHTIAWDVPMWRVIAGSGEAIVSSLRASETEALVVALEAAR